jgi:hypothetical protein
MLSSLEMVYGYNDAVHRMESVLNVWTKVHACHFSMGLIFVSHVNQ